MDEAVVQTAPVSEASVKRTGWLIPIVVFGLLWFELINQLKPEWWLNPQYNYGLIVPLLALYLFWKRWRVRPTPAPPAATAFPISLILLCAALSLPIRFLAEANPDWRLLSWLFALVVVTISLLFLYIVGGRVWVRHFAFPVLFFLVAVPWPVRIEQVVIQDLMRIVTAINVTFLQLAAVPALQHGNVIEVGTGFIGIEEACSGVRSLQATLMVSLFLGALAIWLLLVELGVQIWYRSHHTLIRSRWVVRWPESESHYKQVPVAPAAETLLRYNEGGGAAWEGPDGRQWMMYFFRWLPG